MIEDGTDNTVVRQIINSDPSILLGDFDSSGEVITGTWKVDTRSDDDFMGFVFGYQDPQHYYLFDWNRGSQNDGLGFAEQGMSIKQVNADSPLTGFDLWPTAGNGDRVETLFHNTIGWEPLTDYEFELEFVPGQFTITVSESDTVLESVTIEDDTFANGKFGFYNYSQSGVLYSGFRRQAIPGWHYSYDVDAIDPDTDPLRLQPDFRAAGHGDRSHQRSPQLVRHRRQSRPAGRHRGGGGRPRWNGHPKLSP